MREPGTLVRDHFPLLAIGVFGALCLVVMAVGTLALTAEFVQTWEYYFLMEQGVAIATPVTTTLAVVALLLGLGVVLRA